MTERELLCIAEERPENLLLVEMPQLLGFATQVGNDADLRCAAMAELVARWCLSGDDALALELSAIAGTKFWRTLSDWYNVARVWTGERRLPEKRGGWNFPDSLPGLEETLRRRLSRLFSADGFIPVYNAVGAWFLPFTLDSEREGARWCDGAEIAAWSEPVRRALSGSGKKGICIQLADGPELSASVRGDSLMLPVWMAAARGRELPGYDVLRVLATGAFDDSFRLSDVEVKPKLDAMKRQFRDAVMFAPNMPAISTQREGCLCLIDEGLPERAVLERVRDCLEETPGVVRVTRDYAIRRLPNMDMRVDRANFNRWNEVAAQLEQLKASVDPERDPETWLEFSSLLATALCHAGRTDDSRNSSREAMSFACKRGFAAKALRLKVTAAVNAQDMGEIDEYKTLAEDIARELELLSGPEKDDLSMRFHGTAAQANAFGTIFGVETFSAKMAIEHIDKALEHAYSIARAASENNRDEAESNVAQDLNYRHLMFALFEPGSGNEEEAYANAKRQLNELSQESVQNNRCHLMRQRSLAYLNAWRDGAHVPSSEDRVAVRLPAHDAEAWLVAANRRHLGTLAAAAGDAQEAVACFSEGNDALPLNRCWAPVLGSIRFALLVQAACSLAACGRKGESSLYAKLAEETYSSFGESRLFGVIHAEKWMEVLHDLADPRTLPAFYY